MPGLVGIDEGLEVGVGIDEAGLETERYATRGRVEVELFAGGLGVLPFRCIVDFFLGGILCWGWTSSGRKMSGRLVLVETGR